MLKNFVKRSVKKSAKNFSRATGLGAPVKVGKAILDLFRGFFGLSKEIYPHETFEEAVARLGYSEQKCLEVQKAYFQQALLFFVCALFILAYGVYSLANAELMPAVVTGFGAIMLFTYAFRAHFSYFQIKNRKLGCSFKEWINASVKGAE